MQRVRTRSAAADAARHTTGVPEALTPLQQLIADYLRDKTARGDKESYSSIARRAGMSRATVQAIATRRDYGKQGLAHDTLAKLARGLEMPEQRVRDAAAATAGYTGRDTADSPQMQLLLAVAKDLDPERLAAVLSRARLLHEEMDEERNRRGRGRNGGR